MNRYRWVNDVQETVECKCCMMDRSRRKTGDAELVEGNHGMINDWGDCCCPKCGNVLDENHLGRTGHARLCLVLCNRINGYVGTMAHA